MHASFFIVLITLTDVNTQHSQEEKASEDISLLKAIIEGIKIRINEMRKETYEFKRDIVIGGEVWNMNESRNELDWH